MEDETYKPQKYNYMKTNLLITVLASVTTAVLITSQSAKAAVEWNVMGNWHLRFDAEDVTFDQYVNITQEDPNSGAFTGIDPNYGTVISGQVSADGGNGISLYDPSFEFYSGSSLTENGTIAPDGTIAGSSLYNSGGTGWTGNFWTISGNAVAVPIPEPATFGLISAISLLVVGLARIGKSSAQGKNTSELH